MSSVLNIVRSVFILLLCVAVFSCSKVPESMVFIEEGDFIMGVDGGETDEGPKRTIALRAFYIDKFEVTNAEYKEFIKATKRSQPKQWVLNGYREDMASHPVIFVSFDEASEYCGRIGKRLPTEDEWEKAARGTDGRVYPWGDDFGKGKANTSLSGVVGTALVGSYPEGVSPYGLMDMAGNVWEWTSSDFSDKLKVVRGGSWGLTHRFARTFSRVGYSTQSKINNLGFRCAKDK